MSRLAYIGRIKTMLDLKQARDLVGVSQVKLARAAGTTKFVISDIETKRVNPENVAYGTITRIVRALQRFGLSNLTADAVFPVADRKAA
jgi:predicted transcriptional regulator